MANIISPICFSNANNDSTNNDSDFKVHGCECSAWICVFSPFLKAQEIDVPLASTARLATESELHMFSLKMILCRFKMGWAQKCILFFFFRVWNLLNQVKSPLLNCVFCFVVLCFTVSKVVLVVMEKRWCKAQVILYLLYFYSFGW